MNFQSSKICRERRRYQDGNGLSGKSDKDKPIEGAIKTWDLTATETHMRSRSERIERRRNMISFVPLLSDGSGKKCRERRIHRYGRERSEIERI